MQGIDISNWQRGIDLERVPCDFVIVKSTEGTTYVDPCCDGFVQQAIGLGKLWGFYHYVTGGHPENEADFWVGQTSDYFRAGIPCVDWESGGNRAWGDTDYLRRFVQRVIDKTGVKPLVYASAGAFPWGVCKELGCGAWVAQYASNSATGYQDSPWNEGAYSCVIRQYSSAGRLAGYNGNLDLDKAYITAEQWHEFADPGRDHKEEDMDASDINDIWAFTNGGESQTVYRILIDNNARLQALEYAVGDRSGANGDTYTNVIDTNVRIQEVQVTLAALSAAVKALATSKGADPDAVAKAVSDAVEEKLKTIRLEVSTDAKEG